MTIIKLTAEHMKVKQENALDLFYSGIKAKATKDRWARILSRFLEEACEEIFEGDYKQRAQKFVDLTRESQEQATQLVISYVQLLKQRTELDRKDPSYLNPSSLPNFVKPIRKLLDMNSLGLAWPRIYSIYPEKDNISQGRGYTREEIQTLLAHSDSLSTDFIILAMSSGAFRAGGWEGMTWGNVFPIYQCNDEFCLEHDKNQDGKVVCAGMEIYHGTSEAYTALISIEAWEKLQQYKQAWTSKMGRTPKDSEPLILEKYISPTPMTTVAVQRRLEKLLRKSGLRAPLTEGKRRHTVPTTNGLRRFANMAMMKTSRKRGTLSALVIKERLLGHSGLVNTDKNYFWTGILDMIPDYLEAMPELLISEKYRLANKLDEETKQVEKLQDENREKDAVLEKMRELEAKVERMSRYRRK